MTWQQFKAKVEQEMREKGIDEDIEVKEIDTNARTIKVKLSNGRLVIE